MVPFEFRLVLATRTARGTARPWPSCGTSAVGRAWQCGITPRYLYVHNVRRPLQGFLENLFRALHVQSAHGGAGETAQGDQRWTRHRLFAVERVTKLNLPLTLLAAGYRTSPDNAH